MYDNGLFLRELPVLHKSIRVSGFCGTCTGIYIICKDGLGFISIFCENARKESAILSYDAIKNAAGCLTLKQLELLAGGIGKELELDFHHKLDGGFEKLDNELKNDKEKFIGCDTINIERTKVFFDAGLNDGMVNMSMGLIIGEKEYAIDGMVGAVFEDFSCQFVINDNQVDNKLRTASLQDDVKVQIRICGHEYCEKGIITRIDKKSNQYVFLLKSYAMYTLEHTIINNLGFQNIRNPFVIVKYLLESRDLDVNEVEVPFENKAKRTFLVAMVIENLRMIDGPCSVCDVRIGEAVSVSPQFEALLKSKSSSENVLIWTDQIASNHYEAFSLAKEKIMRVTDLIAFFTKNDCIADSFGVGELCETWDAKRLLPEISLMNIAYIEDCFDRQSICISGNERIEPHVLELDAYDNNNLESEWVEKSYACCEQKNKIVENIFNAIRWVNKVGHSTNKGDSIIYCVMALEFCLYKETGNSIVEDKLSIFDIETSLKDKISNSIGVSINVEGINDEDLKVISTIEQAINSYIKDKLKEPCFNSKLQRMLLRLNIPITEEELKLIQIFRKKRNRLIHGDGIDEITERNIKKMVGIVSRIISYKLRELLEVNE